MFGHPRGLSTLFFTELWERFSYYGMRALLILFMTKSVEEGAMGLTEETAGAIYGLYVAMVYLLCLPGGWLADRLLGLKRAVFIGGCVIAAGHFSMAIPTVPTFYTGLVLIVIGTGFLKPNVSALVGGLYPEGGARRDAGFSIYYMGINLGAFIGPLICGYLGESISWHYGFGAAGVGMIFGLVQYRLGSHHVPEPDDHRKLSPRQRSQTIRKLYGGLGLLFGAVVLFWFLDQKGYVQLSMPKIAQSTGIVIVSLAVIYFAYLLALGGLNAMEKKRVVVVFCLFIGAAVFWSGFEQAGSSMNLFADRLTDLEFLGWTMPASWLQSVNPLFIIILAPGFGWLWVWLSSREPSIPVKFAAGLLLLGVGFLVLAWGAMHASPENKVSPAWLVVTYFLHTSGELCLSPVGLSSVTKLAPQRLVGQMMGVWFMGAALGNLIAGLLGGLFETLPLPQLFGAVSLVAIPAGVLFLIFSGPIKKLIGDVK